MIDLKGLLKDIFKVGILYFFIGVFLTLIFFLSYNIFQKTKDTENIKQLEQLEQQLYILELQEKIYQLQGK